MRKFNKFWIVSIIYTLAIFFFITSVIGQSPQSFNYQAVVRNASSQMIVNQQVGIRITILQNGSSVCVEEFTPTTNSLGLITLALGTANIADFTSIDWSTGTYSIKIELDPAGGTNYTEIGTNPLRSVPFALNASKADNVFSGNYDDLNGKPDLSNFLTVEVDGDITNEIELPTDAAAGDMNYFDGTKWARIEKPINPDFRYSLEWDFANNKPYWKEVLPSVVYNGATLYVHPIDNSSAIPWYNGSYVLTNASSTIDGKTNTLLIEIIQGPGSYAAQQCADLVAFGYDDWYLPAKDELNALYLEKDALGGFSNAYYWSSTEYNTTDAWGQDFTNGSQVSYAKYPTSRVRCVRK